MASSWSITGTITLPTCVILGIALSFRTVRGYDRRMGQNSSRDRSPPATVRLSVAFHERNRLAFTTAIPPDRQRPSSVFVDRSRVLGVDSPSSGRIASAGRKRQEDSRCWPAYAPA